MLLTIITEYDEIHLISKYPIEASLINQIEDKLKEDLILWNEKRNEYFKKHNLNPKDIDYMMQNMQYNKDKSSPFFEKKWNELVKKQNQVNEYRSLYPRPDYYVIDKYKKLGFSILNKDNANVVVKINLESDNINNKISTTFQ